jgi:hypothetical protein
MALLAAVLSAGACLAVAAAMPASAAPNVVPVYGTGALESIACMTSTYCIAVGENDYVLVDNGTNGGADSISDVLLDGIACPTSADCFAVGSTSTPSDEGVVIPFLYGEQLSPITVPDTVTLNGIACTPGTTACIAVGYGYDSNTGGNVAAVVPLSAGSPSGSVQLVTTLVQLEGIACPTATSCLAVGENDNVHSTGGFVPITSGVAGTAVIPPGGNEMLTVACESTATCWAGTTGGYVVPFTSGAAGTPVQITNAYTVEGSTCPTATQCYMTGDLDGGGGYVLPITNGTVGTATADFSGSDSGYMTDLACSSATACIGTGLALEGTQDTGVLVTDASPTPPPTISSVSLSGTGYGLTVTVKGTNFDQYPPEASPTSPVSCAPGSPSYDYASGVLSFSDTTEGWSAGAPGNCIGVDVKSWSNTSVSFGFGTGYVWPLLANGDAYQVSVLGVTATGTASVKATAAPQISSVVVTGTGEPTAPTLTISGSSLGTRVPLNAGSPDCVSGDTGVVFPDDEVFVSDESQGWTGGEQGDCLGLVVTSWANTKVVLTFGPAYANVPLALGDSLEVGLLSATWTGTASATAPPTIKTLTVTGSATAPYLTATGKGFGASPPAPDPSTPISCVAGDTSYTYPAGQLQFSDTTQNWTAGETGDCIGLIVKSWSNTKVVLRLGADYKNFAPVTAGDTVQVEVKGASFSATAKV